MNMYFGKDTGYILEAIRLKEYLDSTGILRRVMLEAEKEKLLKSIPIQRSRLGEIEHELGLK